eukprot:SAG31_NODE_4497_length_3186_cov_2.027859_2_plen_56_part_00
MTAAARTHIKSLSPRLWSRRNIYLSSRLASWLAGGCGLLVDVSSMSTYIHTYLYH